jgi:hypothetical protein
VPAVRGGEPTVALLLPPAGPPGYVECDDPDAAQWAVAATDVNARWQAQMAAPFFADLDGRRPDEGFLVLDEAIFKDLGPVENQLAKETTS